MAVVLVSGPGYIASGHCTDLAEVFACHLGQDVVEVTLVLLVDQTVVEHS